MELVEGLKILSQDKPKSIGFCLMFNGFIIGGFCMVAAFWEYRMLYTYQEIAKRLDFGMEFPCQVYSANDVPTSVGSFTTETCSNLAQCRCNTNDGTGKVWKEGQCELAGFENVQKDLFIRDYGKRSGNIVQLPCVGEAHSDVPAVIKIKARADGKTANDVEWAGQYEGCTIVKWFRGETEDNDWKKVSNRKIAERGNKPINVAGWLGFQTDYSCVALPAEDEWTSDELMVNVNLAEAKKSTKDILELLEWKFRIGWIGTLAGLFGFFVPGCLIFGKAQYNLLDFPETRFVITWGKLGPKIRVDEFFRIDMKAAVAEFIAMTLFVMIGCGAAAGHGAGDAAQRLLVAFAFGICIIVLAYGVGHHSGAQINCAVTFSLMLGGALPLPQAVFNFIGQMIGSVCGAIILYVMFPCEEDKTKGLGSNGFESGSLWQALGAEVLGTFILCYVVYEVAVNPLAGAGAKNNAPLAIGLCVFIVHIVMLPITGCSINPTRSFGPWFVSFFRNCTSYNSYVSDMWVFWLGPLGGAALAAAMKFTVLPLDYEDPTKSVLKTTQGEYIFLDQVPQRPREKATDPTDEELEETKNKEFEEKIEELKE